MTSINDQLGIRRPGKRAFMKLPKTRAEAARVTAAKCPECGCTGARPVKHSEARGWIVFFPCCNVTTELATGGE